MRMFFGIAESRAGPVSERSRFNIQTGGFKGATWSWIFWMFLRRCWRWRRGRQQRSHGGRRKGCWRGAGGQGGLRRQAPDGEHYQGRRDHRGYVLNGRLHQDQVDYLRNYVDE